MRTSIRIVAFALLFLVGCAVTNAAKASKVEQDYPATPVRIIEPFGAGGGPDLLARALAPKLAEQWGQPVTEENIPGAGATVLVAGKAAGVTTVAELIAAAKAKPAEFKFGSTGIGTGRHVGVERFNQTAGIRTLHVPPSPSDSNADTIANAIAGHSGRRG